MAVKKAHPVIIDGVEYPSYYAAGRAYGVTQQTISRRVKSCNTTSLTLADIHMTGKKRGVPLRNVVKEPPPPVVSMSWDFVYARITSSPKKRSVASHAVVNLAA